MKILWFSWKDTTHPLAGGAEVVAHELATRLVQDGHEVILISGSYKGAEPTATINGYKVIRLGNRITVYYQAWRYYRQHLRGWADLVIDEVNTIPFFAKFYAHERNILFVHMLCREIWFYQLPKWLGWIGYIAEPLYIRMLSDRKVITISESTRADLIRHGFKPENVSIISEGIEIEPLNDLQTVNKYDKPVLLSLGSVRPMKRTLDQVKAFELAKQSIPDLQLKVAGDHGGSYGSKVLDYIHNSPFADDIEVLGRVSTAKKVELMQKCHLIMVTSVKEGWGLIVTEAASQGAPAVVYNVDGLRDSVRHGETGLIADRNTRESLAAIIIHTLTDTALYSKLRQAGWKWGKTITFDTSYKNFKEGIQLDA
jgi:glycosyltransferase involved in cell wall biosynthesis